LLNHSFDSKINDKNKNANKTMIIDYTDKGHLNDLSSLLKKIDSLS